MALNSDIPVEVEVFGVSYERYAMAKFFARLTEKLKLKSVLEIPASGAKAMSSIYSLGLALSGCSVTLVDASPDGLQVWKDLDLQDSLEVLQTDQIDSLIDNDRHWDLCWNFMVLPTSDDPESLIRRMMRCSSSYVMTINVNRFNVGFGMHRTVHRFWKIPWTHGNVRFFSPFQTMQFFRQLGLKDIRWGVVDCPLWPDSPGFRDLRLHKLGDRPRRWISPYAEYLREGKFPKWMKWVYAGERLPIPAWVKLPYAHLYYVFGRVDHEAA